jgi:HipA-like protein
VNPKVKAKFLPKYGSLLVGTLTAKEGIWEFEYSNEFKLQTDLRPILDVSYVHKHYHSSRLWQFFTVRIPSLEHPEIEKILERKHIDGGDVFRLLQRFGNRCIADPYRLMAA